MGSVMAPVPLVALALARELTMDTITAATAITRAVITFLETASGTAGKTEGRVEEVVAAEEVAVVVAAAVVVVNQFNCAIH